jgi:hypothetical protein
MKVCQIEEMRVTMRCSDLTSVMAVFISALSCAVQATGQQPERSNGWLIEQDEQDGIQIHTMEMTLHPRAEPIPALKYHLIPDDFDLLDGNAATYYLKAEGFFEQTRVRERLSEIYAKTRDQARTENRSTAELPPYSWQSMPPDELPVKEVKEFLALLSFQPWFLKEAAKQRYFDLDRNIRTIESPFVYLLPEVQALRETARMQSLRCRLAIAEGRIDDAIEILGQQYSMARHLGQDDFIVTTLVGLSIADVAWTDVLHLVQRSEAPNLYWAFASLPRPLVDARYALSVERQFLYLQFKVLRDVDEVPRPAGYWQDFLDRLVPQLRSLAVEFGLNPDDPEATRAMLVAYVAAAYPGAKRYLIEEVGLSRYGSLLRCGRRRLLQVGQASLLSVAESLITYLRFIAEEVRSNWLERNADGYSLARCAGVSNCRRTQPTENCFGSNRGSHPNVRCRKRRQAAADAGRFVRPRAAGTADRQIARL